ncbi:MAG: hypothetical protein ACI9FJ_001658 [Alteromonadaceae bacterium]|jgi:hypothetical protein
MSIRTAAFLLFLSFVLIVLLFVMMSQSDASFVDNMVPELIGFCLEGIFFIGLFSLWQRRKETGQKQQLSRSLRGFLGIFLQEMNSGIICPSFTPIEDPSELDHSCSGIKKLACNINNCGMNNSVIKSLHKLSNDELSSLENLLPVAAQLSAAHMTCWNTILGHVKILAKSNDKEDVHLTLIQLLEAIEHFDRQVI